MKKFMLTVATALLLVPAALRADEGMWLLPLLEKMNADALRNLGSRLTPEQIYSVNNSSIKDAIVQFGGGCTAEIISGSGLLVTNHHCGYSNIQALSSTEHNYLEDGYFALSRDEEIPCPGLTVRFLQSMTDVTDELAAGKSRQQLINAAQSANPNCQVRIVSFYNDNVQYLIVSKIYRDVRFVGAPPASAGKFGGDTDNWMWPRHTCDFSMFRVYADADNEPADYSPSNVPMRPRQFLNISLKGVQEGDFAMIMGYPGSTQRFQTATQLQDMLATNDVRIDARGIRQDVLWKAMRADSKVQQVRQLLQRLEEVDRRARSFRRPRHHRPRGAEGARPDGLDQCRPCPPGSLRRRHRPHCGEHRGLDGAETGRHPPLRDARPHRAAGLRQHDGPLHADGPQRPGPGG